MAGSIRSLKSSRWTFSSQRGSDLDRPFTTKIKNTRYKNETTDQNDFLKSRFLACLRTANMHYTCLASLHD